MFSHCCKQLYCGLRCLGLVLLTIGLDQVTKRWVIAHLDVGENITLSSFLNIIHVKNPGAAFSFFAHSVHIHWFLVLFSIGVGMVLCYHLVTQLKKPGAIHTAYPLIVGGGWSNLLDRFAYRAVVDFLDFHMAHWHWPVFNIADSAIFLGVLLLLYEQLRSTVDYE